MATTRLIDMSVSDIISGGLTSPKTSAAWEEMVNTLLRGTSGRDFIVWVKEAGHYDTQEIEAAKAALAEDQAMYDEDERINGNADSLSLCA